MNTVQLISTLVFRNYGVEMAPLPDPVCPQSKGLYGEGKGYLMTILYFFLLNRNKDKALPRPCYQVCKARKLLEKRDLIISELHKEDEELARMEDAKRV